MYELYSKNLISVFTILLVLGMVLFMISTLKNQHKIQKWGRITALFIVIGIAISAISATRDNFAVSGAIFSMTSIQALICSVAGGVIIVTGLISIFIKNQNMKKSMLFVIFALFMIQVLTVEISRPIMLI